MLEVHAETVEVLHLALPAQLHASAVPDELEVIQERHEGWKRQAELLRSDLKERLGRVVQAEYPGDAERLRPPGLADALVEEHLDEGETAHYLHRKGRGRGSGCGSARR